jgi:uncharacterized GH25 family protein
VLLFVFFALAALLVKTSLVRKERVESVSRSRKAAAPDRAHRFEEADLEIDAGAAEGVAGASERSSGDLAIGGVVIDGTKGVFAGGVEIVLMQEDVVLDAATSGDDGRFLFTSLSRGVYTLTAKSSAGMAAMTLALTAGKEGEARLELIPNAELVVRVRSADGRPIGNAALEIQVSSSEPAGGGSPRVAMTDPRGEYRGSFPPGPATVIARAEGYAEAEEYLTFEGGLETQVELDLKRGTPLRLRVSDPSGAPVTNADVAFRTIAQGQSTAMTSTDGVALFPSVPFGAHVAVIVAEGWLSSEHSITVEESNKDQVLEVRLSRGRSISGHVVDTKRKLIASATVEIARTRGFDSEGGGGPESAMREPAQTVTDEEGRFEIRGLPRGQWELTVIMPQADAKTKTVDLDREDASVEIVVPPQGEPIKGMVDGLEVTGSPCVVMALRRELEHHPANLLSRAERAAIGTDGAFEFDNLVEGEYKVALSCPYGQVNVERIEDVTEPLLSRAVVARTGDENVVLRAGGRASIEGQVSVEGGSAAEIVAFAQGKKVDASQGVFSFEGLGPGPTRVEVAADGFARAGADVILREGERAQVKIDLKRYVRLVGRAVDDRTGEPIATASILATRTPEAREAIMNDDVHQRIATTSADGTFMIGDVRPGEYQITAQHPRHATEFVAAQKVGAEATPIEIRMKSAGDLFGHVLRRGAPVSGLTVALIARDEDALERGSHEQPEGRTDASGRFHIARVREGSYSVVIDETIDASESGYRRYEMELSAHGAGTQEIIFDIGANRGAISVSVSKRGLPGRISLEKLERLDGEDQRSEISATWLFAQGAPFEIDSLAQGRYEVSFSSDDLTQCARQTVEIANGASASVSFSSFGPCDEASGLAEAKPRQGAETSTVSIDLGSMSGSTL